MSAVEIAIEKVKRLDEPRARKLLAWLQQDESLANSGRPPKNSAAQPDFLSRAKAIWGEQPAGKLLSQLIEEARGGHL